MNGRLTPAPVRVRGAAQSLHSKDQKGENRQAVEDPGGYGVLRKACTPKMRKVEILQAEACTPSSG